MSSQLSAEVAIIGGGINGLGIARELSLRNISTIVIEKNDLVSGTSSASSKLAHGGLRYLKEGQFKLVYEALRERFLLLKNAPHLVKPLPFIIPIYKNSPIKKWQFRVGLFLYDLLCGFKSIHPHHFFSPSKIKQFLPQINHENLTGGALYYDAQMDDARLGIEVALDAYRSGAKLLTYTQVTHITQEKDFVTLKASSRETNKSLTITAKYVINAAGPWSNEIATLSNKHTQPLTKLSKGVHILVPKLTPHNHALLLLSQSDQRVFFVMPWNHHCSLIGTTDTAYRGSPDQVTVTDDDINYLLNETNRVFPNQTLTKESIIGKFAGIRPLIYQKNKKVGGISREHQFIQNHRLFHLIGGKYTTFRSISESCCKQLLAQLTPQNTFQSLTQSRPLPGATISSQKILKQLRLWQSEHPFLTEPMLIQLLSRYGSESYHIIKIMSESSTYRELLDNTHYYHAEIIYSIRFTFAKTITDIIRRRTHLFFTPNQGKAYIDVIGTIIQKERQLSTEAIEQQKEDAKKLL